MVSFTLSAILRPNIATLSPYKCARDEFDGDANVFVDANENSLGHSIATSSRAILANGAANIHDQNQEDLLSLPLHRYPSPTHPELRSAIAALRSNENCTISPENIFLGVGSDEIIDLLIRITCTPGASYDFPLTDSILITPPTYGMYTVCANINDVNILKVPLILKPGPSQFTLDTDAVLATLQSQKHLERVKLLFATSPGNPTGTLISAESLLPILQSPCFKGLLVVDEAYIDFAPNATSATLVSWVSQWPNLVIMQTMSKSFGLAAIRLGVAIAQQPIIDALITAKAPYNVSLPTATLALRAFSAESTVSRLEKIDTLTKSRISLATSLDRLSKQGLGLGHPQGGSHANFILIPILSKVDGQPDNARAKAVYQHLATVNGVVVRYRGGELGCEGCLRITIGSALENETVIARLGEVLAKL